MRKRRRSRDRYDAMAAPPCGLPGYDDLPWIRRFIIGRGLPKFDLLRRIELALDSNDLAEVDEVYADAFTELEAHEKDLVEFIARMSCRCEGWMA